MPRIELVREGIVVKRPAALEFDNSNVGERLSELVGDRLVGVAPGEFTVGVSEFLKEHPGIGSLATLLTFKDGKVVHRNVD